MPLKQATIYAQEYNDVSLLIGILSLIISFFLFFANLLGRIGMEGSPNFIPLALSVCLILLPGTLRSIITLPEALIQLLTLAFFLILGWISIAFDINLSFIVLLTSVVCLFHFFRSVKLTSNRIPLKAIVPYIALGLTLIGLVWTQDYMNPLFPEAFATGFRFTHTDTLFHAALTSNIKTYSSASTGLFGLEPMTYHHGSHYLLAAYSKACEMDVVEFYSSGYPVIFVPLFVKTLLNAAFSNRKVRSNTTLIITGGILLFFIINGFYQFEFGMRYLLPSAVNTHFLSQSYCISLILTFIIISLYKPLFTNGRIVDSEIGNAILILLIPVCFFVIGYTKVSTTVVILSAFLYLVLRKKLFFQGWIAIAAVASIISLFGLFELTIENEGSNFQIQPGSYYKHFVQGNLFIYFISYYLFFVLLALIVILPNHKTSGSFLRQLISGKYIILELVLVAAFTGMLPGLLIYIDGGSAYYFSDIQYWLTAVALIHYVPRFIRTSAIFKFEKILSFAYVFIMTIMIAKATLEVFSFVKKNVQIRTALAYGNEVTFKQLFRSTPVTALAKSLTFDITKLPQYQKLIQRANLQLLDSVKSLPRSIKSSVVIYCEDPEQLGEFLDCGQATFYIPALAEIALINGLYWRDKCYVIDEYGMRPYASYPSKVPRENASELAASKGFKYLINVNLGNGTYLVEDLQKKEGGLAP